MDLPIAVIIYLLSYLDVYSLGRMTQVSHKYIELTEKTADIIRQTIESKYFKDEKLLFLLHNRIKLLNNCKLSKEKLLLYEIIKPRVLLVRGFVAQLYDIKRNEWNRCHDLRRDRTFFNMTWHNGYIYCIGTFSMIASGTIERFNPYSNNWQSIESLPRKLRGMASCIVSNKLVINGGYDSFTDDISYSIYEYNPIDNKRIIGNWIEKKINLPYPLYSHACVYYNDRLWLLGGICNFGATKNVTKLDTSNGNWEEGPILNRYHINFNAFVINDGLYVVGGDTEESSDHTIEKLDSLTNTWNVIATFSNRIGYSSAVYNNYIYIFSGDIVGIYTYDIYDVINNVWHSSFVTKSSREIPPIPPYGQAITFPPKDLSW